MSLMSTNGSTINQISRYFLIKYIHTPHTFSSSVDLPFNVAGALDELRGNDAAPRVPVVTVTPLTAQMFASQLSPRGWDRRHRDSRSGQSLYHHHHTEDMRRSLASIIFDTSDDDLGHFAKGEHSSLFFYIKESVRGVYQELFVEVHMLITLTLEQVRVLIAPEGLTEDTAFISSASYGRRAFLRVRLSPSVHANGSLILGALLFRFF